ncbi:MAG: hypothetical protein ACYTE6_06830 [Planctomycetota bacterium]
MRRRGAWVWPVGTVLAAVMAGCSVLSGADPASATRGLSLELWLRGEENLAVLYRVEPAGTIGFGGGADARNQRITWTGPLTAEEIDRLWALLQEHGWFSGDLKAASTGEPRQRQYRIRMRWPGGSKRYKFRGENPQVTPVETLLGQASRRRLGGFLETFPRPGAQKGSGG